MKIPKPIQPSLIATFSVNYRVFSCKYLGDIVSLKLTPENVDVRDPVPELAKELSDKLYGDISKALYDKLFESGVELVTTVRKNMKARLISAFDKAMLAKRFIIETINDQLKNISQIEHSRHRSLYGFILNLMGGLIAYCHKPQKPSLNISDAEYQMMVAAR